MTAQCSVSGNCDSVMNREVVTVGVFDADVVAALADGRILFQLVNLAVVGAGQPPAADVNGGMDYDCSRGSAADGDVAGMREYFEVDGAGNRQRAVKGSHRRGVGTAGQQKREQS